MDAAPEALALSELESMTVVDAAGEQLGELVDVVADMAADPPVVSAFFILHDDEQLAASWAQVGTIDVDAERLELNVAAERVKAAALRGDELALVDAVLDKQVLDMRDRRFVRVQDVLLEEREGRLIVAGVDASSGAVMRRMGFGFLSRRLSRRAEDTVPWDAVNLISLRLSRLNFVEAFTEVAAMHPADLADVISRVGPRERAAVLQTLNTKLAADTLQEMEQELRTAALVEMSEPRAIAVLSEIEPDDAADILADLPDEVAERLLTGLPRAEAQALRDLASHPEHSAGALMTTDFVTMPGHITVEQTLRRIREERPEEEALSLIFVLGERGELAGVVGLHDLVLADLDRTLSDIMDDDVVSVGVETDEVEVARLVTHYNLLALPVTDEQGTLLGVITLDDALESILPQELKQRLPRLYR